MPGEVRIAAQGLTKRYGRQTVVDGIDLSVGAGEFFGFLGPNGAGKSSTLNMLCGLTRPTAGSVRVAGLDPVKEAVELKRRIGVLHEDAFLYERLTGAEYLRFAGQMHSLSAREAQRRTDELLSLMDLTTAADKLIQDYSMGMKKKTALAGILIHGPQVLFLDEPFNGMDTVSVHSLSQALRHLTERKGTTIFLTSHGMDLVERLCGRVAILHRGRIIAEGAVPELRAQTGAEADASLENVFLQLIGARESPPPLRWL